MKKFAWLFSFVFVLFTHLLAIYFKEESLRFISKSLLMPILAIYFLSETRDSVSDLKLWILLALFFSWVGDVLLMFEQNNEVFFLMGLVAFLAAQIAYIVFFHAMRMRENIRGNVLLLLLVVVYYSVLISVLSPHLGSMKLPVRIYGVVLSFMLMLAMHTMLGRTRKAGRWLMAGAVLFVASDSLLAVNKFLLPLDYASLVVMVTYGLGQLLIIEGAAKYIISKKPPARRKTDKELSRMIITGEGELNNEYDEGQKM